MRAKSQIAEAVLWPFPQKSPGLDFFFIYQPLTFMKLNWLLFHCWNGCVGSKVISMGTDNEIDRIRDTSCMGVNSSYSLYSPRDQINNQTPEGKKKTAYESRMRCILLANILVDAEKSVALQWHWRPMIRDKKKLRKTFLTYICAQIIWSVKQSTLGKKKKKEILEFHFLFSM